MEKKRVLIVVSGNYDGAIAKCSWNIYSAYKKHEDEYEVKCVLLQKVKNGMSEYDFIETYAEKDHGAFAKLFPLISKSLWLRKIKNSFAPDYTISTLFSVNLLNVISGGRGKKIGIFHSPYKQGKAFGAIKYIASLFSYNFVYPWLDKLACVSTEVKQSFKSFPLINQKKVEVIYNIHDSEEIISKSQMDIMTTSEKMIFSNPTLLYCGRMDYNKAPDKALLAFAESNRPINAQIVFIGIDKSNLIPKLKQIAKKYSIEDKVHILGKKQNPYPYFKKATALISSSYSEGLPGVMIESLILGTPVVATNSSKGIWEIFSASDQYNDNLNAIFENECGLISTNIAYEDIKKLSIDIDNLKIAINKIWNFSKVSDFKFKKKVLGDTIIHQLINFSNG